MSARALIACSVLAALLPACGDEREPPDEPPAELLHAAAANPAQSGELAFSLEAAFEGDSLLAGVSSTELQGPFALDPDGGIPSFDLALDATVAGFGVDGELVSTGEDAFVVFFGENYRVGAQRFAALDRRLESAGEGLGLRIDRWFRDPRYAGAEEVAGTETERIEGTLDAGAAGSELALLLSELGAPPLLAAALSGAGSGPIEAWVEPEDPTIRQLRVQFPFTVPPELRADARGISGGTVALNAEISDVGADVEVEPPAGGGFQPVEQLIDRLRSLAGLAL